MMIILQSCLIICEVSWWRNLFATSNDFCKKYLLWKEVFWCEILPVMWSVFCEKTILVFCDNTFCDVKYLYFFCFGKFSFWAIRGPVLGLEPWEQPWLTSLALTNGAILIQGERKCKTTWRKKITSGRKKIRRFAMTKRKCFYGEIGDMVTLCLILFKIRCYSPNV